MPLNRMDHSSPTRAASRGAARGFMIDGPVRFRPFRKSGSSLPWSGPGQTIPSASSLSSCLTPAERTPCTWLRNSHTLPFGRVPALSAAFLLKHPRHAPTAHRFSRPSTGTRETYALGCPQEQSAQVQLVLTFAERFNCAGCSTKLHSKGITSFMW
jgi:hypothetical protein